MEMESSRRPFDRSRETGIKKPRLTGEIERVSNPNGRPFPQRPVASSVVNVVSSSRIRINDRDLENEYQPQPPQYQELVTQYKTALAELTFNSKPIITNLTIIAGENLYAAKAVAATVCANIIEVPSEQKLPSLYLLDSIVKNIGRNYIKYFAARLPEVFCKAYRQVDPSVHSSMRHLFGTWKGVFPPQSLQMIEKELRFNTAVNGSSAGATTLRTDSQSQRQPQSIHVNPKYLERQRIQQSSRAKGMANDGTVANLTEDAETLDGAASMSAGRPWVDRTNILHSHGDALNDPINEKSLASYGRNEYGSDLPRNPNSIGKTGGRGTELGHEKACYKAGSGVADTKSSQRNGLNIKHGLSDYETLKSTNVDARVQPIKSLTSIRGSGLSSSWKNSEEEEFMWDDMNSRLADHGPPNISSNSRKDRWTPADVESLGIENHLEKVDGMHEVLSRVNRETSIDSLSAGDKQPTAFTHRSSKPLLLKDSHWIDGVIQKSVDRQGYSSTGGGLSNSANPSVVRMGGRPQMGSSRVGASGVGLLKNATTGSAGIVEQQCFQSVGATSPSEQSPLRQRPSSPPLTAHHSQHQMRNFAELGYSQILKTSQFAGGLHNQSTQDSLPILPSNVQVGNLQRSQPKVLQASAPSTSSQSRQFHAFSQQKQLDSLQSEGSDKTQKPPIQVNHGTRSKVANFTSDNSVSLDAESPEQSDASSLIAAVMKSGIFSNNRISSSLPKTSLQEMGNRQSGVKSPLKSGQPPSQIPSSGMGVASPSSLGPSSKDNLSTSNTSQTEVGQPPLPPSTVSSTSAPTSNSVTNAANPISNLLSSLVSKGLISAKKETLPRGSPELTRLQDQSQEITTSTSVPGSPNDAPSFPDPSTSNEVSIPDRAAKTSVMLPHPSTEEIKNLIGFEFKPNKIRELHPDVIKNLYDYLPHCCSICHIRLKLQDQLDRHLQWHALRKPERDGVIGALKGWYADSRDLGAREAGFPSDFDSTDSVDDYAMDTDRGEPMVPAEENQCVCVLCGDLFEDFYSQERDEWMFKGAIHMNMADCNDEIGSITCSAIKGPIVHAKCISESSLHDLVLSSSIKMEHD
ncbi:polyadenylation and cleavage factor-like 4-like [Quillaja saponaria]|uniref:Polyadenylation and cleavage factor-like 4-like n=1 Tax=Quillaja saponaria TaxID=32244 RepID=A0AAD7Q717_QUISA|nr:polyadenylation and cleavage factor-like 4-like [Quillaja saponaria]